MKKKKIKRTNGFHRISKMFKLTMVMFENTQRNQVISQDELFFYVLSVRKFTFSPVQTKYKIFLSNLGQQTFCLILI
jgi:hypothetical protein